MQVNSKALISLALSDFTSFLTIAKKKKVDKLAILLWNPPKAILEIPWPMEKCPLMLPQSQYDQPVLAYLLASTYMWRSEGSAASDSLK